MKLKHFASIAAALGLASVRFANGTIIKNMSKVEKAPNDGNAPLCPLYYVHLESYDVQNIANRSKEKETNGRKRRLLHRQEKHKQEPGVKIKHVTAQSPPITIVRQGGSFIDFTVQNSTWFAAQAFSDGLSSAEDEFWNYQPLHIFSVFSADMYGSEHCIMASRLLPIDVGSSEIMKARCFNTGSITIVRVYVRFNNPGKMMGDAKLPKCCNDPYIDSSSALSPTVIEYVFKLKCTATCNNPETHFDGILSTSPSFEQSEMPPKIHSSEPVMNPSNSFFSIPSREPLPISSPTALSIFERLKNITIASSSKVAKQNPTRMGNYQRVPMSPGPNQVFPVAFDLYIMFM